MEVGRRRRAADLKSQQSQSSSSSPSLNTFKYEITFALLSTRKRWNMFSPALVCVSACVSVCDHDD